MNELHLFAGGAGGILGGMLLGHTHVCAVEIEPYPRKVLLQRQRDGILPKFPIWDDVKTFDGNPWRGKVDIVCGGFPCTDISSAGKGAGIEGEKSGLWSEMRRVISEVRPTYVLVENSPLLTIRGGPRIVSDLASMGYVGRNGILGADYAGLENHRARMWVVANSNSIRLEGKRQVGNAETAIERNGWTEQAAIRIRQEIQLKDADRSLGETNGVANRVDRLKAIGNGQVPGVVRLAWETLMP